MKFKSYLTIILFLSLSACLNAQNFKLDSMITYAWSDGAWVLQSKVSMIYNDAGSIAEQTSYVYTNGSFIPSTKSTNAYDDQGNMTSQTVMGWKNNNWENSGRTLYSYNQKNRLLETQSQLWSNGDWTSTSKTAYTYENDTLLKEFLISSWKNGEWANYLRNENLSFNESGHVTESVFYIWSSAQWNKSGRSVSEYNAAGSRTMNANYTWAGGEWSPTNRVNTTFNENNKQIKDLYERFNEPSWTNWYTYDYEYDTNGNLSLRTKKNWALGEWENAEKVEHYYSKPTDVPGDAIPGLDFAVWPNPASGRIYINSTAGAASEAQLFDIAGRSVSPGVTINGNGSLSAGSLSGGIYYLRILSEGRSVYIPLILNK